MAEWHFLCSVLFFKWSLQVIITLDNSARHSLCLTLGTNMERVCPLCTNVMSNYFLTLPLYWQTTSGWSPEWCVPTIPLSCYIYKLYRRELGCRWPWQSAFLHVVWSISMSLSGIDKGSGASGSQGNKNKCDWLLLSCCSHGSEDICTLEPFLTSSCLEAECLLSL